MCVLQKPLQASSRMKITVVLLIVVMTICSCGIKAKVSCDINDIDNVITDCKEHPQLGISIPF